MKQTLLKPDLLEKVWKYHNPHNFDILGREIEWAPEIEDGPEKTNPLYKSEVWIPNHWSEASQIHSS